MISAALGETDVNDLGGLAEHGSSADGEGCGGWQSFDGRLSCFLPADPDARLELLLVPRVSATDNTPIAAQPDGLSEDISGADTRIGA